MIDGLSRGIEVRTGNKVTSVSPDESGVVVETAEGTMTARSVVAASGGPAAVRSLLPDAPSWRDLGGPLTAAALDVAVRGAPSPGYVLGVDQPLYGTTQSPPARQAPEGESVVAVLRYGATDAAADRAQMERWLQVVGVQPDQIVHQRFLANMAVTGTVPRAVNGGWAGRPDIAASGASNVFLAGDWIGPRGVLADAALASGHEAGLAAARVGQRTCTMVQ